jgi:hypothetical protein
LSLKTGERRDDDGNGTWNEATTIVAALIEQSSTFIPFSIKALFYIDFLKRRAINIFKETLNNYIPPPPPGRLSSGSLTSPPRGLPPFGRGAFIAGRSFICASCAASVFDHPDQHTCTSDPQDEGNAGNDTDV